MKQLYILFCGLILLPVTFTVASTTGELGHDVPENQLLTAQEVARYQAYMDKVRASVGSHPDLTEQLRPDGYHMYFNLFAAADFAAQSNMIIGAIKSVQPALESKIDPLKKQIEFYLHPIQVRDELDRLENEKKLCLIL